MSEEQDKQRNTRKKENNRLLTKAAIIGVVAGLLGGDCLRRLVSSQFEQQCFIIHGQLKQ